MIPFDGDFAQNYVYPLALGAYDATNAPPGFTVGKDAFEILVDMAHSEFRALLTQANPKHKKMLQGMLDQPRKPPLATTTASFAQIGVASRAAMRNQPYSG